MAFGATTDISIILNAIDKASPVFNKIGNNLEKMKPTFQKMALIGTAAFVGIGAGIWKTTQTAVAAQEIFSKFDTVFDDVGNKAEEVAKDLRDNWGLATSTAKELLASTGDLLSGFGFTGDAALDLSKRTQKLAIDLASFTNLEGGAARASQILTKAMLGEKDSLVALGIKILDADVNARLLADGKENLTGLALRQAKAEITLQLAMEQSGKAIGDYERTSESAANQQRLLQERMKELSETFGQVFIPILQKIIDRIVPVVEKIRDWIEENPELAKNITIAALAIAGLVAVVGGLGLVLPAIITGFTLLLSPVGLVILAIGALIAVGVILYKNWDKMKAFYISVWEGIKVIFWSALDFLKNLFLNWTVPGLIIKHWDYIVDGLTAAKDKIINAFLGLINWFKDLPGKIWDAIKSIPGKIGEAFKLPDIGGLFGGIGKTLGFQEGGVVPGVGPRLAVVHGGETITPKGRGFGNINIYVQGGNYLDRDAGEKFAEVLGKMIRKELRY